MAMNRFSALMVALAAIPACSPAPASSEQLPEQLEPARCVPPGESAGAISARAVTLGEGSADTFAAYEETSLVPLQLGWQGGYMITPRVRVGAQEGDAQEVCWQVRLHNDADTDWLGPGFVAQLAFQRHGDAFYSDPVNNLLTYDADQLAGQPMTMDISISGIGIDEETAVTVTIAAPNDG